MNIVDKQNKNKRYVIVEHNHYYVYKCRGKLIAKRLSARQLILHRISETFVCMYVCMSRSGMSRFRNVELDGYIRLIFITSKLIYYWHNYAEKKSYVAIHIYT